jgi:predicted amidophosphoribosyltransferase
MVDSKDRPPGDGEDGVEARGGAPAGFPDCWRCPFRRRTAGEVCLACLQSRTGAGPAGAAACPVCDQAAPAEGCGNDWCTRADRWFSVLWAIAPNAGAWRWAIRAYKYRRQTDWAAVFGRILLGYLEEHMPWFDEFDVLTPMPAFTGPGARRDWDHVGDVVAVTRRLAGPRWDFCGGLVVKDRETPALAGLLRPARRRCAEGPLRQALRVPNPGDVAGRRILVVDDVFTEGSTLREVARALRLAGADEVACIALARQPWHEPGRPAARPAATGETGT